MSNPRQMKRREKLCAERKTFRHPCRALLPPHRQQPCVDRPQIGRQAPARQIEPGGQTRGAATTGAPGTTTTGPPLAMHPPLGPRWNPAPHPPAASAPLKLATAPANRVATKRVLILSSFAGPVEVDPPGDHNCPRANPRTRLRNTRRKAQATRDSSSGRFRVRRRAGSRASPRPWS